MNPYEILDERYTQQFQNVERTLGEQENLVREQAAQQYDMLAQRYQLERRYIEATPMDWEQQRGKIQDLNKKYEMKALELHQKVQPHFQDLQSKKAQAIAELQQDRQARQARLKLIDELVQNGTIPQAEVALKEQLQTVGVPVSLSDLQGPPRKTQIADLRSELSAVTDALKRFALDEEGVPTDYDVTGRALVGGEWVEQDLAPVTPELASLYPQLKQRQAQLLEGLGALLTQEQAERPGLHQFSGSATRIAARRNKTFQEQAAQLVPQKLKPIPQGLVEALKAQGFDRQQAEQWLRKNGYDVKS